MDVLSLPTHEPAKGMTLLQYVSGDTFRCIREEDDALGEEVVFELGVGGQVLRYWQHSNFARRLPD